MKFNLKTILAIGVVALVAIAMLGNFAIRSAEIQADKAVQVEQIEQKEKTERTEERSQFWQKLVPWGEDEEDAS